MLSEINVLDFQAELGGHSHSIISQHYPFSFSLSLSEPPTGTQQIENSMHHRAHAAQFYSLLEPPSFPCGPLFFFLFFNLQISFVCVLQNCKLKAPNTYKYEKATKHKGEQSWSWQLPVRHLCLMLLVDMAGFLIPQLPQNKYCVPLDLIRHSACAQEIQKQPQDFTCSGSSKLLATHKNLL